MESSVVKQQDKGSCQKQKKKQKTKNKTTKQTKLKFVQLRKIES